MTVALCRDNRQRSRRQIKKHLDELILTKVETANFLRTSVRSLERLHLLRSGPPQVRVGGLVRYRKAALIDWLQKSERP